MAENNKPRPKTMVTGTVPPECAAVMVYSTFPDLAQAEATGRALVEARVAGCINILAPMVSIYAWGGAIERAQEVVLLAKTSREQAEACMVAILVRHPYETPAVLAIPIAAGAADYLAWIMAGTASVHEAAG